MPAGAGPGTHLKALLASLGFLPAPNCPCRERMRRMDTWGVAECRRRREEILGWLREEQAKRNWVQKAAAAARAVASGLAFRLDPADVAGSLLEEALRRAEGGG